MPIQIMPLPTYASGCNPIEQLWCKLKRELLHLHPWAANLPALRQAIDTFLATFATGSPDLLHSVGLGVMLWLDNSSNPIIDRAS